MKRLLAVILSLLFCAMACQGFAAEEEEATIGDVFDTSEAQANIEELGLPTVSIVEEMGKKADKLFDEGNYREAAAAYEVYAKNANMLANLIAAGLEPYYSAKYDDRKDWSPTTLSLSSLAAAEKKSNGYKAERNRAILRQGLCFFELGEYAQSLPLLQKALDLIEIYDEENWEQGMNALYTIIGFGQEEPAA